MEKINDKIKSLREQEKNIFEDNKSRIIQYIKDIQDLFKNLELSNLMYILNKKKKSYSMEFYIEGIRTVNNEFHIIISSNVFNDNDIMYISFDKDTYNFNGFYDNNNKCLINYKYNFCEYDYKKYESIKMFMWLYSVIHEIINPNVNIRDIILRDILSKHNYKITENPIVIRKWMGWNYAKIVFKFNLFKNKLKSIYMIYAEIIEGDYLYKNGKWKSKSDLYLLLQIYDMVKIYM